MADEKTEISKSEQTKRVKEAFLIFSSDEFLKDFMPYTVGDNPYAPAIASAVEGFSSIIAAAELPFQLIHDGVIQRRFDRMLSAEGIRALIHVNSGSDLTAELKDDAYNIANTKMSEFLESQAGREFTRDQIIDELDRRLKSKSVENAASELRVQTLISTWSIFESFSRSFLTTWINENPASAPTLLSSPELKEFFGRNPIDIREIERHGFDLTNAMGSIIFQNRRLDGLHVIRGISKALFNSKDVQLALGHDLWVLNQRRHLFVHNRGIVDQEYVSKTGDLAPIGERLPITCSDIKQHFNAVRSPILELCKFASHADGELDYGR